MRHDLLCGCWRSQAFAFRPESMNIVLGSASVGCELSFHPLFWGRFGNWQTTKATASGLPDGVNATILRNPGYQTSTFDNSP
jgi:hypothetical protein